MAFFAKVPDTPDYNEPENKAEAEESLEVEPAKAEGSLERDTVKVLSGSQAQTYLTILQKLVRRGKLNKLYPSGRGLENLFYLMTPDANRGLIDKCQLNLKTGLPTEPETGRVIADKEIAQKFLQKHDVEAIQTRQDEASQRLLKKVEYYREASEREIPPRFSLELKLQRVFEEENQADFIALFQRFDPGEGVFTRYTIQLSHQHSRWSTPKVELKGDDLRATDSFRGVISRYSSDEAEFAFILLSRVEGITVKSVERGRAGPLWMEGVRAPKEITDLLHAHPGNFIMNFPLERVAISDKEDKIDSNRDPFGRFYRASLDPESKAIADARAEELGYVVHKERKFACTRGILKPLQQLLKERGAPCVIYSI